MSAPPDTDPDTAPEPPLPPVMNGLFWAMMAFCVVCTLASLLVVFALRRFLAHPAPGRAPAVGARH